MLYIHNVTESSYSGRVYTVQGANLCFGISFLNINKFFSLGKQYKVVLHYTDEVG